MAAVIQSSHSVIPAVIVLLLGISFVSGVSWDYSENGDSGYRNWHHSYPSCSSSFQSPIDIDRSTVRFNTHLITFDLPGYETIPRGAHWEMTNTGNMVQILLNGDYKVKEGGLPGKYKAIRMDFHFGKHDEDGSEHLINGTQLPMELQILHYNTKYGSYDEAISQPDGLAVFAFLFRIKEHDNPIFMQIVNNLQNIKYRHQQVTLRPVPLLSLLPINLNNYYRYDGSLTSPPCTESVIWTVFSECIEISSRQMDLFQRSVFSNTVHQSSSGVKKKPDVPLRKNFRPAQPLNDRVVYSSNIEDATLWTAPLSPISITLAVLLGFIVLFLVLGRQQRLEMEAERLEYHRHHHDHEHTTDVHQD